MNKVICSVAAVISLGLLPATSQSQMVTPCPPGYQWSVGATHCDKAPTCPTGTTVLFSAPYGCAVPAVIPPPPPPACPPAVKVGKIVVTQSSGTVCLTSEMMTCPTGMTLVGPMCQLEIKNIPMFSSGSSTNATTKIKTCFYTFQGKKISKDVPMSQGCPATIPAP